MVSRLTLSIKAIRKSEWMEQDVGLQRSQASRWDNFLNRQCHQYMNLGCR
jgi:hypothetical protein